MKLDPRTFDPLAAPDEEWQRYYAYLVRRVEEAGLPGPPPTLGHWQDWLRTPPTGGERRCRVVEADGKIVSGCSFTLAPGDPPRIDATAGVLEGWRGRGIGTTQLREALDWMDETGAGMLVTQAREAAGHAFLRRRGFEAFHRTGSARLEMAAVDRVRLTRWVDDLARRAHERMVGREGRVHIVVARGPDGTLAGMTDAGWRPDRPASAHQGLTGVLPEHQARGLAKALKARMILHFLRVHPDLEYLSTANATRNAPILSINDRLGYRRTMEITHYRRLREAGAIP